MAIPLYLAMTGAEFQGVPDRPSHLAWLSCLFSPYGSGLSNLPKQLPPGSLLILSDQIPVCGHDPAVVKAQLEEAVEQLSCCGILLDFQRPMEAQAAQMAKEILALPCPVAISEPYAKGLDCAVFLPPIPPDQLPENELSPWSHREIWLEIALDSVDIRVTEQGIRREEAWENPPGRFRDEALCCHYDTEISDGVCFHLQRTAEDVRSLLVRAEKLGVTKALGLYQELG